MLMFRITLLNTIYKMYIMSISMSYITENGDLFLKTTYFIKLQCKENCFKNIFFIYKIVWPLADGNQSSYMYVIESRLQKIF